MRFKGRDFISLQDYERNEIWRILRFARDLKKKRSHKLLSAKCLAMIFQKTSTRTSPEPGLW